MFTGVAVLGVLAGSLASLFGLGAAEPPAGPEHTDGAGAPERRPLQTELAALRAHLIAVEQRLAELPDGGERGRI